MTMSLDILLVEDNEGDARLVEVLLAEVNKSVRVHRVADGVEAMAFLRYQGPYLDVPRPDVILLDLQMPKMSGLEVLAWIKTDPWLAPIPIIVFTSSQLEADVVQSYQLMANCYLAKPRELKEFEKLVRSLNDHWLTRATFPKQKRATRPATVLVPDKRNPT
jgi:two-component system, chemotaxis family, response regulator Rcp1